MNCFERLLNWININNIPTSETSLLRDLLTIGIINEPTK
jgi:hypothetical protein